MATDLSILDPSARPLLDAAGLQHYHDYIRCLVGRVVGHSGTTLTRRLELGDDSRRETVYLKRYQYVASRWRHRFRPHKAWIEHRNYRLLKERCGINVPDVLAFGARRRGLRLLDAFLLTRAVEGATPLDEFLLGPAARRDSDMGAAPDLRSVNPQFQNPFPSSPHINAPRKSKRPDSSSAAAAAVTLGEPLSRLDAPRAALRPLRPAALSHADGRALLHALAGAVARMHAAGFFHWDLQWRNILVRRSSGDFDIFLIDSSRGGLRRTPIGRAHGRIRDLFCLDKLARRHLSRTTRLRFLRAYLGPDAARNPTRRLIRRLLAYVDRKSR